MISIEVAPSQLEAALNYIKADHDDATVTFTEGSTTAGHVHTSQIDADFEYQQRTDSTGTLIFTNEAKHGMYKFVSDSTIGQHIVSLLAKLPPVAEAVQAESDAKAEAEAKEVATETLVPSNEQIDAALAANPGNPTV